MTINLAWAKYSMHRIKGVLRCIRFTQLSTIWIA
jgi:hypothetical protein